MSVAQMLNSSQIRLRRMEDGCLRVHEHNRNFYFCITPDQEKEKDEFGLSMVLVNRSFDMREVDLIKLAKRMGRDDINKNHDWFKNWKYLNKITRNN